MNLTQKSCRPNITKNRRISGPRFVDFESLPGLFQIFSDMACVCQEGEIKYINEAGMEMLEAQSASELLGCDFSKFIHPECTSSIDDFYHTLSQESDSFPIVLRTLGNTDIRVRMRIHRAREIHADTFVLIAENINDHPPLSKMVHRSEKGYRHLVANALDMICVSEGNAISYINASGLKMLGATSEAEVIGRPISAFTQSDYCAIIEQSLQELARENTLLPIRLRKIDGQLIDADVGFVSLDGAIANQIMIEARDITAHNRAVAALRASIDTLEQRVEERTRALRDEIAERQRAENRYRQLATHDMLTNLPNRALLPEKVEEALKQARRTKQGVGILFVDLDGFKAINDTYGHDAGDQVLIEVALRLKLCLRRSDTAARMGGDEFVIILSQIEHRNTAAAVAQKVLKALAAPFDLGAHQASIGASIGIALYPEHGPDYDTLLSCADNAMYHVKSTGKNGYFFPKTARAPSSSETPSDGHEADALP